MKRITVAVFQRGSVLGVPREIENAIEPMQAIVGGWVETFPLPDGLVLVCNEEGQIQELPISFVAVSKWGAAQPISGDFFVCRTRGVHFASLKLEDFAQLLDVVRPI